MTVPHRVTVYSPIGHIDIPRAVCLILVCHWFIGILYNCFREKVGSAAEIAAICPSYLSCAEAVFAIDGLISFGIKILGFLINLSQLEDW